MPNGGDRRRCRNADPHGQLTRRGRCPGCLAEVVSLIECICCHLHACDKNPECMDLIYLDRLYAEALSAAKGV